MNVRCMVIAAGTCVALHALPAQAYTPIRPSRAAETVTLTGKNMTADQVVAIARGGARVRLSQTATQRSRDAYDLLIEGAAEGVPIYWFNRGDGAERQVNIFTGDPLSAQNEPMLRARQLAIFQRGARGGYGPEIDEEALVRAIMAVRVNTMSYEPASPQLTQMLQDLLNRRVTPVVYSRGSVGEGDLVTMGDIGATMVGSGDAYYRGVRMSAAQALRSAGLRPLQPGVADDSALTPTNAYACALAAFAVYDGQRTLDWADLIYAMDLIGMNSSVTPLSGAVQANRPIRWLNFDAKRVLNLLKGSYLFEADPNRIIQDPESLRASSQRQGAAWDAWAHLRDALAIQMNSSDHNPAVRVGASPGDSWDMQTPQMMQFYVRGGPRSNGQHGYILSDANWDPYPLANDIEAFTIAFANMDVAISQRIQRFKNPFFTVVKAADILGPNADLPEQDFSDYLNGDLWQQISGSINPVAPTGNALIAGVEDLQAQTHLKGARAREIVSATDALLGIDLLNAALWMDVRKKQNPARSFGIAPAAAWTAIRRIVPLNAGGGRPDRPIGQGAQDFMRVFPASGFYPVTLRSAKN